MPERDPVGADRVGVDGGDISRRGCSSAPAAVFVDGTDVNRAALEKSATALFTFPALKASTPRLLSWMAAWLRLECRWGEGVFDDGRPRWASSRDVTASFAAMPQMLLLLRSDVRSSSRAFMLLFACGSCFFFAAIDENFVID